MVTKIKLNEIVIELPDKPGSYETGLGTIGLGFGHVVNGGGDTSPAVILDCSKSKELQTRANRGLRLVNIRRDGTGGQQIGKNRVLSIETDYWGKERF